MYTSFNVVFSSNLALPPHVDYIIKMVSPSNYTDEVYYLSHDVVFIEISHSRGRKYKIYKGNKEKLKVDIMNVIRRKYDK